MLTAITPPKLKVDRAQIESLLAGLKCKTFNHLTHVGFLNNQKKSNSMEGPFLSVSECPAAWRSIAKLGGITEYLISRKDRKPISLIQYTPKSSAWKQLKATAIQAQWVTETYWYWTPITTDEEGEIYCTWRKTYEEPEDDSLGKPQRKKVFLPNTALQEFWDQDRTPTEITPWHTWEILLTALITLNPQNSILGIYWNEQLDANALSAPRGSVFPNPEIIETDLL
jgi:hypothetical protein